jgi:putative superfamily III holin-X
MAVSGRANGRGSLRDRSLPELIGNLAEQTSTLVRQEVQLAKAELLDKLELMREDAARRSRLAGLGSAFAAAAAVMGVISLGLMATLLVTLLAIAMPVSAAVGIVLALFLIITGVLAYIGIERLRSAVATPGSDVWRPVPEQTIETLKEDIQWAKHPTRSAATSNRHADG